MKKQLIGLYQGKKVTRYYNIVKGGINAETSGVDSNVFQYLKKILPNNLKGKVVLDIGCGDGRWSEYLCKLNAKKVIGLDISQDMLDLAKQRKQVHKLNNLSLVNTDMRKTSLQNKSIDLALSTFSLMYFNDLEKIIEEISRVLKPKGEFYIITNILEIKDTILLKKLKGKFIFLELGLDKKKIRLENAIQTLKQYRKAFKKADLVLKDEKIFPPTETVRIASDCRYKQDIILKKAVFHLRKED